MATSVLPWRSVARGRIWSDEPLAKHTSLRIGGPVDWFAEPEDADELCGLLAETAQAGESVVFVGGGTNLLVSDRGFRGLAIRLHRPYFTQTEMLDDASTSDRVRLWCGAGVAVNRLVTLAAQAGWGDTERLAGLPGSVGGAVAGNAQEIGQFIEAVVLVDAAGVMHRLEREALHFAYRHADLPAGIIVRVQLSFPRVPPADAASAIDAAFARRKATQDLSLA